MKIIDCMQGSSEWFAARCGLPSASNFDKIVDVDGNQSKQRKKYLYQLAGEGIAGLQEETYQNAAMLRGIEMEEEARRFYEIATGNSVVQVGLCIADGYAASPDGLVGEEGAIEIKCPLVATHVAYLLEGTLPNEYFQQVQGQLLVTGRKWVDFISYYPGLKPLIVRVAPDNNFLTALQNELRLFCDELKAIKEKIS